MQRLAEYSLVDAHVHIHPCFDLNRLVLIALQNFRKEAERAGIDAAFHSFLFLTESAGVDRFAELRDMVGKNSGKYNWRAELTEEKTTLCVVTEGGQRLFVVSGRQIVTAEKLEVLAAGLERDVPDGVPLHDILLELDEESCLKILPWGVGKWFGKRGELLSALVDSWDGGNLFLGDNGNRPSLWPKSELFQKGEKRGWYDLPGSDPFPFAGQEKKVGSSGFLFPASVQPEKPFASLAAQICRSPEKIVPFINRERTITALQNQVAIQLKKRLFN